MIVNQMRNAKGLPVKNQFIIDTEQGQYFQSYQSIIVFKPLNSYDYGAIQIDRTYWDYSSTTGKYRNLFLNEKKPETEKKLKSGEYIFADLNKS